MAEIGEKVDADDARVMVGRGEARMIDIRPLDEIERGKPPGSVAVGDEDPEEAAELALRDSDQAVIVVCGDGDRSAEVAADLREKGYEAASLDGGWSSWVSAGNEVMPQSDSEYEGPELVQPGERGGGLPGDDPEQEEEQLEEAGEEEAGEEE